MADTRFVDKSGQQMAPLFGHGTGPSQAWAIGVGCSPILRSSISR